MIFKQYYLGCLAHASYLIGDEETHTAAVVDPQRDVDQYVRDAEQLGLKIRHVFLTHFHADFIAGHLELRDRLGADIRLGGRARAEYAFVPMKDGDAVELGRVRLEVVETPGHTPESISILVFDRNEDGQGPESVLTGDTLFVGDVGRPDLRASLGWSPTELGSLLYDSLHQKLLTLPDETRIYPAHGAGSLCGKQLGSESSSTIGVQRRLNYALQPMTKQEFISLVLADQPDAPPYFTYDAVLNTKERPTLEKTLERALKPLALDDALRLRNVGAQILDVRDPAYFAAVHLAGSINVGLGGQFASWAGTLLDREKPIVIIAEPGREQEAGTRLGRIGFDHVAGYLQGGMRALDHNPEPVQRTERWDAQRLADELASPEPPLVLDVRTPQERKASWIDGSLHIPLNHLHERLDEVPRDRKIVVQCAGGYRSSMGASILKRRGIENVADLTGGIAAWQAAKLPTAVADTTAARA
jgi:glyoxylase-like metal-dependent hydrolase (beta-lactamase superfamily II)/rhodanese-related sulfurtransferase